MQLDTVFVWILSLCMAQLLGMAAWHKFKNMTEFKLVLSGYELLPFSLLDAASKLIMVLECLTALALLLPSTRLLGALLAASLMFLYGCAMAINLLHGRRLLDCGCHINSQKQPISWHLVIRNLMFAGTMLLLLLPESARVLNLLDWALILFGVVIGSLIYLIYNQLNYAQSLQLKG
jgi:Methylamine utilisation protein MauE.